MEKVPITFPVGWTGQMGSKPRKVQIIVKTKMINGPRGQRVEYKKAVLVP